MLQDWLITALLIVDRTDLETNECLDNNGGCWQDPQTNITACKVWIPSAMLLANAKPCNVACRLTTLFVSMKDTFRGRVCQCPFVSGVHYAGDGYTSCEGAESLYFFHYHHLTLICIHNHNECPLHSCWTRTVFDEQRRLLVRYQKRN